MRKEILIAIFALYAGVALAVPSSLSTTGGALLAYSGGNVSLGTNESMAKLSVNGSILETPGNMNILGYYSSSQISNSRSVFVSGKYAYVAAQGNNSLTIFDIYDPSSPSIVGRIVNATKLKGSIDVFVSGKYAYVTAFTNNSLNIIDVSNKSRPIITGYITDSARLNGSVGVYVSGRYAYVTAYYNNSLNVIDISNPSSPSIVGSVIDNRLNRASCIYVSGRYAYVTAYNNNSLNVIDISNPSSPSIVGSVTDSIRLSSPWGVYVSGRYAYVTSVANDSFNIIDISNPSSPSIVGSLTDSTRLNSSMGVQVSGKYAYVTAFDNNTLNIIDISNPSSPSITGSMTSTSLDGAYGVQVSGKYAYVTAFDNNTLNVIDISGISAPAASIGTVETGSLRVTENALIFNDLYVGSSIISGGLYSQGLVSIYSPTDNTTPLLHVGGTTTNLVAVFGNGTGKLYLGTADPVYTINGKQYATYLSAMTGVKEETTGTVELDCRDGLCSSTIDFSDLEEGSDLWLFSKTTDLRENFGELSVIASASFKGRVWYEKNRDNYTLAIFARPADAAGRKEVSYRLTAPRFDHGEWGNENSDGIKGFVIG